VEARERVRNRAIRQQKMHLSKWLFFIALVVLTFMFCATLNLRMQAEAHEELEQQSALRVEIEQLQNANSTISNELNQLQNDSATIERAARQRLNMVRMNERIIVPARKL
jgi:cell division protein FtsB